MNSYLFTWILEFVLWVLRLMNYWNSYWVQPYFFHFNLTTHYALQVPFIRWKTISPPELRKISTWYLWSHFNSVGTPYKRSMSLWKKIYEKEQSVMLALKPEQGPRGIWRKPLKPGALNLYWLGVTDLNASYKGE